MTVTILTGDCRDVLRTLPDESVHCCVTSPPYFNLRNYGCDGQIGLESSVEDYVAELTSVFREVRRVLRSDGVLFLNLGDSYFSGSQRATACGTSGKAPASSQDYDCLCGSLCDACRAAYRIGKSHSGGRHAPAPAPSLSKSSHEHRGLYHDHPPTSGSVRPADHNADATPDHRLDERRAAEPPRVSLASMTGGFFLPSPRSCSEASILAAECQLCGRSLAGCAPASADSSAGPSGTPKYSPSMPGPGRSTSGKASTGGASAARTPDMACDFCSCLDHTTTSRSSLKPKNLIGLPWRVAFALQADGWYLRSEIIWAKMNPMPESVKDRPTRAHETVFLLSKSANYYYNADAIKQPLTPSTLDREQYGRPRESENSIGRLNRWGGDTRSGSRQSPVAGRNIRSVWTVAAQPFKGAHFACFPPKLVEPCVKAGTSERGCCPDCGASWVRVVEKGALVSSDGRSGSCTTYDQAGKGTSVSRSKMVLGRDASYYALARRECREIGWRPTCSCDAGEPVPCTVIDPFFGAGTAGLVAQRLGRDALGIELNPNYVALARARIDAEVPPLLAGVAV